MKPILLADLDERTLEENLATLKSAFPDTEIYTCGWNSSLVVEAHKREYSMIFATIHIDERSYLSAANGLYSIGLLRMIDQETPIFLIYDPSSETSKRFTRNLRINDIFSKEGLLEKAKELAKDL